jgi:subtilisin family serine protease
MVKRPHRAFSAFAASVALLPLAACGGGGGGSTASTQPAVPVPTPTPSGGSTCASVAAASDGRRLAARGGEGDVVPDRLYVTYRAATGARGAESAERAVSVVRAIDLGDEGGLIRRAVTLPPGTDAGTAAAALRRAAGVVDVARVHYRTLAADAVANDQYLDTTDQWYLYRTAVDPTAWSLTHGGANVSVAVIDTGVDETNPDFIFDVKERIVGGVRTTGSGAVQDTHGHGTNTAGLATAQTNDAYGFAGVGYATHLQAYKIFPDATPTSDCQKADSADEAAAIRDAVANGASVINLSLGSAQTGATDPAEQSAVQFAIANNVVVVAANGNEYPNAGSSLPDLPAGYPGVIAVGASAVQDAVPDSYGSITTETVASYSNSGPTLVAPGGDATSTSDNDILHWIEGYSTSTATVIADRCSNSGGVCRGLFNGTSQAAPQVAGTVALMEALHGGPRSLTPAAVTQILRSTADTLPGIGADRQGAGRLNAGRAVAAAR